MNYMFSQITGNVIAMCFLHTNIIRSFNKLGGISLKALTSKAKLRAQDLYIKDAHKFSE